jgi:carbonic anhydrase
VFKLAAQLKILFIPIVVALLSFSTVAFAADEHSAQPHWGYTGDTGPTHWGELSPEYAACSHGKDQSPVNITHAEHAKLPIVEFDYKPSSLVVINNGHTIESDYDPGSSITIDGKTYNLVQFHFHHVSENTLNGKHFPIEGHLVHKSADGKLAVVAVFFDEGRANPAIATAWANMPKTEGKENKPIGVKVDASQLLPSDREYYMFSGSLTTPPCTEGVTWLVMAHKMTMSKEQIEAFAVLDPNDYRPVQPLNGRKIQEGGK